MKTNVARLLTGMFALALLLAVGLSANISVQAQTPVPGAPDHDYVCSNDQGGCTIVKYGEYTPAGGGAAVTGYYTGPASGGTLATPTTTATGTPGHDNVFVIAASAGGEASTTVTIHNLDLPRVTQKVLTSAGATTSTDGPDANPKTISVATAATIVAVHKSSGLTDARCADVSSPADGDVLDPGECEGSGQTYQVKAFNGNRIQISYTPGTGDFASIKTVLVDNGRPTLVSTSPEPDLIVKGNTDVTFSADITDSGSGYTALNTGGSTPTGINALTDTAGTLSTTNNVTDEGGVRLVVAGNVVALNNTNFTKIDGGWRVSTTINSSALQSISTNVPWYWETRDRANNVRRTSGSVTGTVDSGTATTFTDDKFAGNLNQETFLGSSIRMSRKVGSNTVVGNAQRITAATSFSGTNGVFTVPHTAEDPLYDDAVADRRVDNTGDGAIDSSDTILAATAAYQCPLDARDTITVEPSTPSSTTAQVATVMVNGVPDDNTGPSQTPAVATQLVVCQPTKGDSYEILGTNLITIDSERPTLASDNPIETGIGYNATTKKDKAQRNSIKVRFTDTGKAGDTAPGSGIDPATVTKGAFTVTGHTVEAVQPVGNSVYLTLADDLDSTERPFVDIAGASIMDRAGNAVTAVRQRAVDRLGPKLSLSEDTDLSRDKVTVTITTDEQLNAAPSVYITEADKDGNAVVATNDDGDITATPASPIGQKDALSYTYTHQQSVHGDGEYSVYVRAADTGGATQSTVGNNKSAAESSSFTFELDRQFNRGAIPKVTVSNADNENNDDKTLDNKLDAKVETISPMIVTVDYNNEAGEYPRDSYKKVTLTSAVLKITFSDGASESRTFDLDTEVSSQDSIKYTIPMLNPKLGTYALTVKGEDSAGNTSPSAGHTITWEVIAASPRTIGLEPGWNLISLPFQPANPAINSVIPEDHPIGLVMTFDGTQGVWLFSRRDAETGKFTGDVSVITATSAYFVNTDSFEPLKLLRPPLATAAAAPAQPPAITVSKGWNLVPVSTNDTKIEGIDADTYFGTLGATWLQALAWDSLSRSWIVISPNGKDTVVDPNPIPARTSTPSETEGEDPTISEALSEDDRCGRTHTNEKIEKTNVDNDLTVGAQVCVGEGLWLWVNEDGTLIPRG